MFSELRTSAADALLKAKSALNLQQQANDNNEGCDEENVSRNTRTNPNDTKHSEFNESTPSVGSITSGISDRFNNSLIFSELRTGSSRALEKAKLVLTNNRNATSDNEESEQLQQNETNWFRKSINNMKMETQQSPSGTGGLEDDTVSVSSSQQSATNSTDRLEELAQYCPQLTIQQRLIGFTMSFSLGCTCMN